MNVVKAVAMCAAGIVPAYGAVHSANMVGYHRKTLPDLGGSAGQGAQAYEVVGPCFESVSWGGPHGRFLMSDLRDTVSQAGKVGGGGDPDVTVQHLVRGTDHYEGYKYVSPAMAEWYARYEDDDSYLGYVGWWNWVMTEMRQDDGFAVGDAFLVSGKPGLSGVETSGQVIDADVAVVCLACPEFYLASAVPREVTLGEFLPTGSRFSVDYVMTIGGPHASEDGRYTYMSEDESKALYEGDPLHAGWYDMYTGARSDEVKIPVAGGFIAHFRTPGVTVRLPGAR